VLISIAWLRELVAVDAEPRAIAAALTARGLTVDAVTAAGDDTVLDIDVPANRPDALGHRGVAREVAAAFGRKLEPARSAPEASGDSVPGLDVTIDDASLCGRYTARIVRGVAVGPSPPWVVKRLEACGLRSINSVVDVSNLVMLELGQPVHFFDLARLTGTSIGVRAARAGERVTTLDGVERSLGPGMVVITDGSGPIALGGVMGGAATEIRPETADVLIEAAWFAPGAVRRTARGLGIVTDASQRFERGADPEAPSAAQDLAALWLSELASGRMAPGTIDRRPAAPDTTRLTVRLARAATLLGYAPGAEESVAALAALELSPERRGDVISVTVPSWRVDLQREPDVVEEIGRSLGYDRVPTAMPASAPRASSSPPPPIEDAARDRLASRGFHEAITYAMIGSDEDAPFVLAGSPPPIPLENPISSALSLLRRSLLPGLLRAADQNVRRGTADVRLFEVGRVFLGPDEPLRAGFVWAGGAAPAHWSAPQREADPYDAAGLVEDVLTLSARPGPWRRERAAIPALHPGQSIVWRDAAGTPVAWCGTLHPSLEGALAFGVAPLLGEIDLTGLGRDLPPPVVAQPIANLPAASRDLSLVLDRATPAGAVIEALAGVPSPAPATFRWIDRYEGPGLAKDEVSMTLRVILQPRERTLLDAETEAYRQALIAALSAVEGARLRRTEA
jgi:phenylalanyl-tRNA synthetase beta chain